MQVAGFVLVGGQSSRMGRDKARLPVQSHLLVEDVAYKVGCIAKNVALVGESLRYRDLGLECLDDLRASMGPLAGVEAALASRRGDLNLVVACDMPSLKVSWLEELVRQALDRKEECMVAQDSAGIIHPLCSVWKSSCLPRVEEALASRRLRLFDLLESLNAHRVSLADPMYNVNTPEEWQAWQTHETRSAEVARLTTDG